MVTVPCAFDGPDLDEVADRRRVLARRGGRRSDGAAADRLRGRVLARLRLPRRAARASARGAAARPAAARSCRPARWPWPTGTPPSTRPPRPAAGSWSGAPAFRFFSLERPPYAALAPGDRSVFTVAGAGEPVEPAAAGAAAVGRAGGGPSGARGRGARAARRRPGRRPPGRGRGRRARAPGRPTRCRSRWPTGWSATRAGAGALEITGGGHPAALPGACHVAVVGGAPAVRVDGSHGAGRTGRAAGAAGSCSRSGRCAAGCAPTCAVAGGLLGPEVFGSRASDELSGLGPGPLGPGRGPLRRTRGRRRSVTTCCRGGHRARRGRRARSSCASCRARTPSASRPTCWPAWPAWRSVSSVTATGSGCACEPNEARPTCGDRRRTAASSTRRAW